MGTVRRYKYEYLLVERWNDAVTIRLYPSHQGMLRRFKEISVAGTELDDCDETPEFSSSASAFKMVDFVRADFSRRMSVPQGRSEADLRASVENEKITNCISFAIRGGSFLGEKQHFVTACIGAIRS